MQTATSQANILFGRDDTIFGICEALGEDFGFNPFWLRAALAAGLIWNPLAIVGSYAALGALVLVSRLIVRNPRLAKVSAGEPAAAAAEQAETLALAA